jgi:hypothetical protein
MSDHKYTQNGNIEWGEGGRPYRRHMVYGQDCSNVLVGLLVLMLFVVLLLTCWFYCVVLKKEINGEERRRRWGEEEGVGGN